mgnify:CR=1 FL=1
MKVTIEQPITPQAVNTNTIDLLTFLIIYFYLFTLSCTGKELLESQIEQTKAKVLEINEDLAHLRTNSITVEVNMARLFNANVKAKKLKEIAA